MAIHYSKEENAYLRREVANFRKKVKRLQRKGVSQGLLPTNVKVSDLKRTYTNWQDLEAKLEDMRSFTSVGKLETGARGLVGTDALFKFKQKEIDSTVVLAKQRRESLRLTKGRSAIKTQSLKNLTRKIQMIDVDIKNIDFRKLQRINANALTLEAYRQKQETFYDSFYDMIFQASEYSGVNENITKEIKESLDKFSPEELSELLEKEDTISDLIVKYNVTGDNKWLDDPDTKADFRIALNNLRNQLPRMLEEYGKS